MLVLTLSLINVVTYKFVRFWALTIFSVKLTLDSAASEKFLSLIHETLNCLEHLFSRGSVIDSSNIAEELLPYLTVTFILDSTATIRVVNQVFTNKFSITIILFY